MAKSALVGVDLGGTKIYTAVADLRGRIISEVIVPTGAERGPAAVIDEIVRSVDDALCAAGIGRRALKAVGAGAPGPVVFARGLIADPPNLPRWCNVPLGAILEERLGTTVLVDNDANLAGLAEVRFGAAKGFRDVVYVTVSTGIGGGIIFGGEVFRGADGAAGEVGHMTVLPGGPRCNCGNRGCLEAVASGTAFRRLHGYTTKDAAERIARGGVSGRKARRDIDELAEWLGLGLANLANILNPQVIVVGGGLSNLGPILFVPLRKAVKKYGFSIAGRRVKVLRAKLGKRVGVMGAIALALE
ncbi:MAG: ROK family protein [Deltaproteobacteria bacterium]|nr:ROK family protein [Deltaproteobacteria bacterium]